MLHEMDISLFLGAILIPQNVPYVNVTGLQISGKRHMVI